MNFRSETIPMRAIAGILLLCWALAFAAHSPAQMVSGRKIPGFAGTFGVPAEDVNKPFSAQFVSSTAPGNILWPGEQAGFTFQLANNSGEPIAADGKVEVIAFGTKGRPGDIWVPDMFKIADAGSLPVRIEIAPNGFQNVTVEPKTPERFGAYALVVDLGKSGRRFITSFVRTFKPSSQSVQFPQLALDVNDIGVLTRLGAFPNRIGIGYKPTTDADFETWFAKQSEKLAAYKQAKLPVMLEIGGGAFFAPEQPLGRPRPWLDNNATMLDTKFDLAWLPAYDADFRKFVKRIVAEFGWPRGPINGIKLWNEPWEGISISGWGADVLRYREIFLAMAEATREACRKVGVEVLVGGCDSSSNTFDKLFADGRDDFLPYLDFVSIHYQGMAPPSTVKAWVDRKGPRGRVRVWDTESWVANCDDRVAAVIATNLSTGHDRAVGIYGGNICTEEHLRHATIFGDDGKKKRVEAAHTWPVAAAVGAANHFIGERKFKELLFKNGLPWVMVFDGLPGDDGKPSAEDATVVVVGDIGEEFGADWVLFRTARGLKEIEHKAAVKEGFDAARQVVSEPRLREQFEAAQRKPEPLSGATMTLKADGERFALFDFYGNAVPAARGEIAVPLDHRGFFLRGDGKPGSFAALLDALRAARIEGIEPLATVCHDMTAPIASRPALRLTLTNVLNRKIRGALHVTLGKLQLDAPATLSFEPNETKDVAVKITGGDAAPNNTYPLALTLDAGADGRVAHDEDMHVNWIARRTIHVDGELDDWKDVPPQTIAPSGGAGPTLTEAAWFPFMKFDAAVTKGFATGYLAYDDVNFYFAAKIADDTPDDGMPRFETRNDDDYFYPEKSYAVARPNARVAPRAPGDTETPRELVWPEGVRRFSYRKRPELPNGNAPNHDNVQIAFNVLPPGAKPWYPCPPGTMPGYVAYSDTDYEYALNPVAAKFGGGTEIWRLRAPGMPHKHFYPRQPKSPFDGPVKNGALVIRRDGNTRIVEAAIPWTEIPEVKRRIEAGGTIKFSFRVNDNAGGGCMELSRDRSVAKRNYSFFADWVEHWANELEFGAER
jgi:hypothetical protein